MAVESLMPVASGGGRGRYSNALLVLWVLGLLVWGVLRGLMADSWY